MMTTLTTLTALTAQAGGDISAVPADFVKNFFVMLAFAVGVGGAWYVGRRGQAGDPLHVQQPLSVDASVTQAPIYAQRSEVDALKADIERRTRENLRQHEETARQLAAIVNAGHERQQTILQALSGMESRMTTATLKELKDIHERLNPLAEQGASHKATLKAQAERITHLWDMIQQLWAQVFRKSAPRG